MSNRTSDPMCPPWRVVAPYAIFIVLVVGMGSLVGILTAPGEWYAGLVKLDVNPPSWVFPVVWTMLYVMIAIAGARVWLREPQSLAMRAWWTQILLNWLWAPVFFSLHLLWFAVAIIVALWATIAVFIAETWINDRISSTLFVVYLAWVSYASALCVAVATLN
jgi:translocator protein